MIEITNEMIDRFHAARNNWLLAHPPGGYYESNRAGMLEMLKDVPTYEDGVNDALVSSVARIKQFADGLVNEFAEDALSTRIDPGPIAEAQSDAGHKP